MQVLLLDPAQDGAGVQEGDLRVDRRVERSMHGDQVVAADELVQLDVVHVTALAGLRCVQHDEHVVGVDVDLGHVVALDAVAHRDRVKTEHADSTLDADVVAHRDVDPDDAVLTFSRRGSSMTSCRSTPASQTTKTSISVSRPSAHSSEPHAPTACGNRPGIPRPRIAAWDNLRSRWTYRTFVSTSLRCRGGWPLHLDVGVDDHGPVVRLRGRLIGAAPRRSPIVDTKCAAYSPRSALDLGGLDQRQHLGHVRPPGRPP